MRNFFLNLIATLLVVLVNTMANTIPINGQTTGEISDKLDVLFTPAGYVFAIWGLIYVLLFIWTLRQFPSSRRNLPLYEKATPLYLLSSILNISWILLWHYEIFLLTVVVMICLLLTLIGLYGTIQSEHPSFWDRLPFSTYLGWISVATIANISYYLKFANWEGWGLSDLTWTIIMLVVATILAMIFLVKQQDRIFPLVFVWAFIGIGVKNATSYPSLTYTAIALAAILFLFTAFSRNRLKHRKK